MGPGNGICNSGLTTGSDAYDGCLTASCCGDFDACISDAICQACLTGSGSGCEANQLFNSFYACNDNSCPTDICDTGIGFTEPSTADPNFACNACADANCCASLSTCVQGGSDQEVNRCLDCLDSPDGSACLAAPAVVRTGAIDFNACIETSCNAECPFWTFEHQGNGRAQPHPTTCIAQGSAGAVGIVK